MERPDISHLGMRYGVSKSAVSCSEFALPSRLIASAQTTYNAASLTNELDASIALRSERVTGKLIDELGMNPHCGMIRPVFVVVQCVPASFWSLCYTFYADP
jgi:hypothetical protein